MSNILSSDYALHLGELLNDIVAKANIKWVTKDGVIREGQLRSLVNGDNDFGFIGSGKDVRDAYVWITSGVAELTESVNHLVNVIPEGGYVNMDRHGN